MKIFGISTTTNEGTSTSRSLLKYTLSLLEDSGHDIEFCDANKIHIVKNLSCYANGKKNCASREAGDYRCWAHFNSIKDPEKYGGEDQMGIIYDGINSADLVLFSTSTRWMSHSSLMQKIIERMDTFENRAASFGEENPLKNKFCGVVVTGQHYQTQKVAENLQTVMRFMGFKVPVDSALVWQNTLDMNLEQDENNFNSMKKYFILDEVGGRQLSKYIEALESYLEKENTDA